MGSDWEEFCEANGWNPGSEEDYEKFLDSLEGGEPFAEDSNNISDFQRFDSYEEAAKWAKANPGRSVRRAENGLGFEAKPLSKKENFPSAQDAVRRNPQKLPDRGAAIWSYQTRTAEILYLAPHLHDVLNNSASTASRIFMRPFSHSKWEQELRRLSIDQLQRLRLLIAVHLDDSRQDLALVYAEMKRHRKKMKPGHYGEALSERLHEFMESALADIDRFPIE